MRCLSILLLILLLSILPENLIVAQDTLPREQIKKGWSFGGVPAIAYNSDKGFLYGVIGNLYNFGDGSSYPSYKYSIKTEISRTTKGTGVNDLFADLRDVLPFKMRLTAMTGYYTNTLLPFYGFNGYDAKYNLNVIDQNSSDYISRAYYALDRKLFRFSADLLIPLKNEQFKIVAGIGFFNFKLAPVNVALLNKTLDEKDKLKQVSLYEDYLAAGVLPADQVKGGIVNFLKTGIVFDTRDNEPNPASGYWIESTVLGAPSFLKNKSDFLQLCLIYRHYLTLYKPRLTFAYRLMYQGVLLGNKPYFFLPFYISSFKTQEAFGGVKTIRGVLDQRLQGNGVAMGNLELRYKFLFFNLFKQNFYLSANTFLDGGQVVQKYQLAINNNFETLGIQEGNESLHLGTGAGLRVVMNQNFIVSVDYGRALNKNDGISGLYIDLDFLY